MKPEPRAADAADPVDDLLAECLVAADPIAAIEQAAGSQPALAAELRQRFAFLLRAGALPDAATSGADDATAPRRLGNFELKQRLGGGGMGVVYRATEQPIGRDVALKLIRPEHLWFEGAQKRFVREIEAVAALDHPGIVPIYSAGEHDGVPFCAMELVRGRSLADLLAELRDGGAPDPALLRQAGAGSLVEACFRIAVQVAQALAHGHERGIVHRDVKPSNIMLGDDGRARLIDFGLCRVAGTDSMTQSGVQPGSLAYMSPEQARGEEVDARTDVWSLGVTLYELLTLRQPFLAATEAATRQQILAGSAPALRSRHSRLPWDAATVVATAMAPERERRYATMAAFAADLQAFLQHRPIRARRPGPLLRSRRWLQRHPARAAGLLLLLVVFGVLPSALLLQERAARRQIEREAHTARRVLQFLQDLFHEVEPEQARGDTLTARVIVDRGVQRIRSELQDEPEVRAELLDALASVYLSLGRIGPARQLVEDSLQLRREGLRQGDDQLRGTLLLWCSIADQQGREAEAEPVLQQLLATAADDRERALCRVRLAYCSWRLDRLDDAERGYRQGLAELQRLLPPADPRRLEAERSYARFLVARVDPRAARDLLQEVRGRAAQALPADHPDRLGIELELALAEAATGETALAETRLRAAIATAEHVFDADHPLLALLRENLALTLMHEDRYRDGMQVLEPVQASLRRSYAAPHHHLARTDSLESSLALELGDLPRAEAAAQRAIAMYEQLFPHGHLDFAHVLANLARIETLLGHLQLAEQLAQRSVDMHRRLGRRDDALVLPLAYLSAAQSLQNELPAAEQNAREALRLATEGQPRAEPRTLAMAQTNLAEVLLLANQGQEAEALARQAIASWQGVSVVGGHRAGFVLGWALDDLGQPAAAEGQLRSVLQGLRQFYPDGHLFCGMVLGELGVAVARQRRRCCSRRSTSAARPPAPTVRCWCCRC